MKRIPNIGIGRGQYDDAIFSLLAQDMPPNEIAKELRLNALAVKMRINSVLQNWPKPKDQIGPMRKWEIYK